MRGLPRQWDPQKAEWALGVQLTQALSNFLCTQTTLRFGKHKLPGLNRDFWFSSSEWGLRICVPSTFSGEADVAGPGTTLWKLPNLSITEEALRLGGVRGVGWNTGKLRAASRLPGCQHRDLPIAPAIRMKSVFVTDLQMATISSTPFPSTGGTDSRRGDLSGFYHCMSSTIW